MNNSHVFFRLLVKKTLKEHFESLSVAKVNRVKIDQFGRYSITLSNGMQDSVNIGNINVLKSVANMYGCKNIFGTMSGENKKLNLTYEFQGIECEGYVKLDTKKITIKHQA